VAGGAIHRLVACRRRGTRKADLLILDNWGPDRLTANQRRDLMEIIEDRYGCGATLITSQLHIDKWHDVIGEPSFADAVLDRIVHNAYRLELDGPSMRKLKTTDAARNPQQPEPEAQTAKQVARLAGCREGIVLPFRIPGLRVERCHPVAQPAVAAGAAERSSF
jgi:hypothetical protein